MAFRPKCFPHGSLLPLLPVVILVLGLIFTFIRPYCLATSLVAIVLGIISVIYVLIPACIQMDKKCQVKRLYSFAFVNCVVNVVMEAICHNGYIRYIALAFWALGAIITALFAWGPIDIMKESPPTKTASQASAPGIEITDTANP
ncbi:hypothetical protein MPSEU_000032000 [Mayamaea pseudoterrestris]|nr:hypothetical protein MPSEU_000032000 [Mayamaea pseudoterrestris]